MRSIRLTITQRLWLGLGLILALFAAANLVSMRASRELDATLAGLIDRGDARTASAYEMKTNLEELVRALEDYVERQDPRHRARLRDASSGFERALARYRELSTGADSTELARRATERYAEVDGEARGLMRLLSARAEEVSELSAHQAKVHSLLRSMPHTATPGREPESVGKRSAAQRLQETMLMCAHPPDFLLAEPARRARERLATERQRLAAALARYRSAARSREEREWAEEVAQWHQHSLAQADALLEEGAVAQRGLANLLRAKDALDALLDERVQPAAKAELAAALDRASATAHEANTLMTRGLVLALLFGALAALATSRAVKAPLRALVASSKRFAEGDFAYRAKTDSGDELGELTRAFNEMAERLQATTVSRSYMESLVSSMGEALLVVSADGTIETVNPATEKLLAYPSGELMGKPLSLILDAGLPSAGGSAPAPSRFTAQFRAREGSPIPVSVSAVPMQRQPGSAPAVVCIAQDLRERLAAERDQRQAAVVFDNTREGIVLADAQRNIVVVNPAFTEITGYEQHEVQGRLVRLLWSKRHDSAFCAGLWRTVEEQGEWQGEIWLRRKGGELRPVWKNISVVRDASGQIVNHVAVFSDITAIKDAEQRLHYLAYHDPLTALPNRLQLAERLRAAISRAERLGTSVALLYLDLDNFKHVNDTLGHEEGDRLLQSMAGRLQACVRGKDGVARLGGDEFILVLEDVTSAKEAARVAEKILTAMSAPFDLSGFELRMRASIGISLWPQHGDTAETLLKAADAAMYRAKGSGRGRYEFFSPDLAHQALERLTLESALRNPKLSEQLVLHYQPQFSVRSGSLVGVEALLRWQHPERGLLSPQAFVSLAEEASLIEGIGEWVLRTACAQARQWLDAGHAPIRMAVNVSAYQIRNDRIVGLVESALSQARLEPQLLELEVTEGALQTVAEATEILARLKALGVQLALDDFGTGYSALSSLKLLPFDRLKIDRSFVRDLEQDPEDRALAKAIIAMGRSLGLEIVAEGVETPAQLAFLRKQGCDEMQGYLFGPPADARELAATLRVRRAAHVS